MTRPAQALIDLDALRHNYLLARNLHGGRALAVIKANAYGHGAVRCAQALHGIADGFAVAFAAEAFELRAAGIEEPILILEGCFDSDELIESARLGIWTAVHQKSQIDAIEKKPLPAGSVHAWLKVDSGMNRAGFELYEVAAAHGRLSACDSVADITLMTHFAQSDEPETFATQKQIDAFDAATADLPGPRSLSNSGGILAWPLSRRDWARVGILLYGADPMPEQTHHLVPVMTLQSEVFAVKMLEPGESLGYGATFTAKVHMRIGLIAMGYADGYPRCAPTGTPIAVDGFVTRTIGRVSMDMLTVDLTDLPQAGVGSKVECWGRQIDINTVAKLAGTISYELLCNVKRVPIVYSTTSI